jgi:hypothetical protein
VDKEEYQKMNGKRYQRLVGLIAAFTLLGLLSGCAAMHTAIAKKDLDVQTKMSDAVFLEPVGPDKRVIFIQVRNTSDKQNFDIEQSLKAAIVAKGYRVVDDPDTAHYKLLAQVLSVAKSSPTAAEASLQAGFGGVLGGAGAGALIGAGAGGGTGAAYGAGVGALVGGLVSTIANAAVKDVVFVAITDVQISEKAKGGVIGRRNTQVDIGQGTGGRERQTFAEATDEKSYRTRIVSTANKVNLDYEEAAPELTVGLTRSLAGLF